MDEVLVGGASTGQVLALQLVLSTVDDCELAVSNKERHVVAPDRDLFVPSHTVADNGDAAHRATLEHEREAGVDVDFGALVIGECGYAIHALTGRPKDDVQNVATRVVKLTATR